MNELLKNICAIIIAQIKADQTMERVSIDSLKEILDDHRIKSEGKRELTAEEKKILLDALKIYLMADLNYAEDLVRLERGIAIVDKSIHVPWDPSSKQRFYWRKQKDFLRRILEKRNGPEGASNIINSIDFETEAILNNMEDPLRKEFFDSRGLVVGFVQSGKTANFTALISKAADAGYRFVIVLAGIHDELRQQTQIRIDRELTGHNNLNLPGDFEKWNAFEEPRRWVNLTSAGWLDGKETGEFSGKGINKFRDVFLNTEKPVLAIIKKNVKIMDRLLKWMNDSDVSERSVVPILIIDDEADQASVDGNATKKDSQPSETNSRIRQMLKLFDRSGYVGYTATPFANVFIKYDGEHDKLGDDIYPRNFVHSLPEPMGYFGTRRIFNNDLDQFFVQKVLDPKKEKMEIGDRGAITEKLIESIFTFILGIAIRNLRGQSSEPMSMMINVDHRVTKMDRVGKLVEEYVNKTLKNNVKAKDLIEVYKSYIATSDLLNQKLNCAYNRIDQKKVIDEAIRIIKEGKIKVKTLNSGKKDKLDYAKEPDMKVIAVGGNKLSRGLTLEGLMVTFYLRESRQFDTLLQMGRWFGYRRGYEDLVRIYTSQLLWNQFKALAIVELEFRASIKEMVDTDLTPADFAISVKRIQGLLPVARNRMGSAGLENYLGRRQVSVTRLALKVVAGMDLNEKSVRDLISLLLSEKFKFDKIGGNDYPSLLTKKVPIEIIEEFIEQFLIAQDEKGNSLEFEKKDLLDYLIKRKAESAEFKLWNVAIISIGPNSDNNIITLAPKMQIRAINRSRLKSSECNGSFNIKAVSSKTDRVIDLQPKAKNEYDGRTNPILLLYFISRNSVPVTSDPEGTREALYEALPKKTQRDPVSYSIIFPTHMETGGAYKKKAGNK